MRISGYQRYSFSEWSIPHPYMMYRNSRGVWYKLPVNSRGCENWLLRDGIVRQRILAAKVTQSNCSLHLLRPYGTKWRRNS